MIYCGIGSRQTPQDILTVMTDAACYLSRLGYMLRSGGAAGADTAFEKGSANSQIFTANDATQKAITYASYYHPAWDMCDSYTRKLHGRNSMIILGQNLDDPCEFVMCWCVEDKNGPRGGTGMGIRIARANNIKVLNMYYPEVLARIKAKIYDNS